MTMFTIYKALIGVYLRLGRDVSVLRLRIGTTFAMGEMTEEEYAELILDVTPEGE